MIEQHDFANSREAVAINGRVENNNTPNGSLHNDMQNDNQNTVAEIDRVRDIIFGGQQREIDRRFKTVERKVESLLTNIQEVTTRQEQDKLEMDNHLNALEARLRQQIQILETALQNQRREIYDRLSSIERQFTDRLGRLEQNFSDQHDTLQEGKVDRFDLGDLLMEAGMRLRGEKLAGQS